MAITSLRALASSEGLIIEASGGGKWKTATQMTAIPWIMARKLWGIPLEFAGEVLLYVSLTMSLWSAKDYVVDFFRALKKKRELKIQERRNAKAAKKAAKEARRAARLAARQAKGI
jgi:phosphatidylglycerophosphate synthase